MLDARAIQKPWLSPWWAALVRCAEKGGHTGLDIVERVSAGRATGWPTASGYLVLERTEDRKLRIWLGVGRDVRRWCGEAERLVSDFARSVDCRALLIEGRRGWRRILPHWTPKGEDLELDLTR